MAAAIARIVDYFAGPPRFQTCLPISGFLHCGEDMMSYRQVAIIAAGIVLFVAIYVSQEAYKAILGNLLVNVAAAGFGWEKMRGRHQRVTQWVPMNLIVGIHVAVAFFIALGTFEGIFSLIMGQLGMLHAAGQLSLPDPDQVMQFATTLVGGMLYAIIPTFVFVACAMVGVYDRSPSWPTFALAILSGLAALYGFDYLIGIDPGLGDSTTVRAYLRIDSTGSSLADSLVGWTVQALAVAAIIVVLATLGWLTARFVSSAIQENLLLGAEKRAELTRQTKARYGWQLAILVAVVTALIMATEPGLGFFDVFLGVLVNLLTGSLAIGFLPTGRAAGRFSALQLIAACHLAVVYLALLLVIQEAAISDTDILVRLSQKPGVVLTDEVLLTVYNAVNGSLFISCIPVSILFASILIGLYDRSSRLYVFLTGPILAISGMFLADPLLGIPNGLDNPELGFQVFGLRETPFPLANEVIGYAMQLSTVFAVGCAMGFFGWLVARLTSNIAVSRTGTP